MICWMAERVCVLEPPIHQAAPFFPGTMTITDVDAACAQTPFPVLTQNPAVTSVAHV